MEKLKNIEEFTIAYFEFIFINKLNLFKINIKMYYVKRKTKDR